MNRFFIFDIPIDTVTREDFIRTVRQFLHSSEVHYITTPNPEMVVATQKDGDFKKALRTSHLAIPDGIGIVWALRRKGVQIKRMSGIDAMVHIARIAKEEGKKIFLLGAGKEVAKKAGESLKKEVPGLTVVGATEEATIENINSAAPDIIFVAYGHGKQEKWIINNASRIPSLRIAMGVGGSFDFLAREKKRAPMWMQNLGMEWFFRLLQEPKRIGRIWNAVVVFPYMILTKKERNIK